MILMSLDNFVFPPRHHFPERPLEALAILN